MRDATRSRRLYLIATPLLLALMLLAGCTGFFSSNSAAKPTATTETNTTGAQATQQTAGSSPAPTTTLVTQQPVNKGNQAGPYLGVTTRTVTLQISSSNDLRDANGNYLMSGELIVKVQAGSPASVAGLQPKDVILALNDATIDDAHPLANMLLQDKPGDVVELHLVRDTNALIVKVVLGAQPPDQDATPTP